MMTFDIPLRSKTYSANEINLLLVTEDNVTKEWVEIDPQAFTGDSSFPPPYEHISDLLNGVLEIGIDGCCEGHVAKGVQK